MKFSEPKRIAKLFNQYKGKWMIAGGWAIDLFLNKQTRNHSDIEIAIPRNEQLAIKSYLAYWRLGYIKSAKTIPWIKDDFLELPIHEIYGIYGEEKIEILLNEFDEKKWRYRRNLKIEYPSEKAIITSKLNIPILCPEIVLLYKSKSYRKKDENDFLNSIEMIDSKNLKWLCEAIQKTHGINHQWIEIIRKHMND